MSLSNEVLALILQFIQGIMLIFWGSHRSQVPLSPRPPPTGVNKLCDNDNNSNRKWSIPHRGRVRNKVRHGLSMMKDVDFVPLREGPYVLFPHIGGPITRLRFLIHTIGSAPAFWCPFILGSFFVVYDLKCTPISSTDKNVNVKSTPLFRYATAKMKSSDSVEKKFTKDKEKRKIQEMRIRQIC